MTLSRFTAQPKIQRLPEWVKTPLPKGNRFVELRSLIRKSGLNTVCESASCPNQGTCWDAGTLTLMILGDSCSRACRFCDVDTGKLSPPRAEEPLEVARALEQLNLRYAVVTSVDRDDLPDGGAGHWAETIRLVRQRCPDLKIEALIPDFRGDDEPLSTIFRELPDVLAHNLETVESLQSRIRPQCRYSWSLKTLELARKEYGLITKSALMLGHGETKDEIIQTFRDLVDVGCRILSLGQYLRPSRKHIEVQEYIHPEVFAELKETGESLGLEHVEAGPLVRSSYRADLQAQSLLGGV